VSYCWLKSGDSGFLVERTMMRLTQRVGGNFARYALIAAMTGLLAGCGGGSGDGTDPIDTELGEFDPLDLDGNGIPDAEDPDYDAADLDGDGILNLDDDDVNGDGILNEDDDDYVAGDADGDGFTDATADAPCGGEGGTDNKSANNSWDDNCVIERQAGGGQFADSLYTAGIQRVIYCAGFGDGADYAAFADGEFGPGTEAAMQDYQADSSLTADGAVGPQTWAKLQSEIELLTAGTFNSEGVGYDTFGFKAGRCADSVLFYQETSPLADGSGVDLGGWTLAKNPPSSDQRVPFSTDPAFNQL
jgi:peptidoglycan hydrolase-like protein with peptidoglycan-binding domain